MPALAPNAQKIQTFFHRAFDASSSEAEQQKAISQLRKMFTSEIDVMDIEIIERKPINLVTHRKAASSTINTGPISADLAETFQRVNEFKKNVERVREENDTIRAQNRAQAERIAELNAKIAELEAAQAAPAAVSDTGEEYVAWVEFEAAAIKAFGREGGWKSVFAFEADMDVKTLNAWQTVGVIPAKFLAVVKGLTEDQRAPASRKQWGDTEYERLKALVDEDHRDREIAKILSRDFGRRLVETSITGARRRLFRAR